jgi:transposase InsO family protein
MAMKNGRPGHGLNPHSDQGVQYVCKMFQALLQTSGIQSSMSRKGNCWDNAVADSVFHALKVERIPARSYPRRQEDRAEIFDYIEVFYNWQGRHSVLGYLTPAECEKRMIAA